MFNLFKKKSPAIKIVDKIWMYETYKLKAFANEFNDKDTIFIFWFDETLHRVTDQFAGQSQGNVQLMNAREISPVHVVNRRVIMAEHYPLQEKENALFQKLGLQEVKIWSALDEPLFRRFGGDKIIGMMKQLGMKEEEAIEHNMISKAIRNAQDKIANELSFEQSARSQADWLEKNFAD